MGLAPSHPLEKEMSGDEMIVLFQGWSAVPTHPPSAPLLAALSPLLANLASLGWYLASFVFGFLFGGIWPLVGGIWPLVGGTWPLLGVSQSCWGQRSTGVLIQTASRGAVSTCEVDCTPGSEVGGEGLLLLQPLVSYLQYIGITGSRVMSRMDMRTPAQWQLSALPRLPPRGVCVVYHSASCKPRSSPAPPDYPLRNPKYHLMESIRPLIKVHWGL